MTNREMLLEIKKVEPIFDKLSNVAHEIVERTFDCYCCRIEDLIVGDKTVKVVYQYHCGVACGYESVNIPFEWFDEGFDYESAYREMKQKEVEAEQKKLEAEKKRKAAAKKAAVASKAKKEYETYLKLKKKFETNEKKTNNA